MAERSHSIGTEGLDVGIIGGLAVAVWFLVLDIIRGHPLPDAQSAGPGSAVRRPTPETSFVFGAFLLYTAFHFLMFALIGMGLVALVHWSVNNPVVRYALLPLFLAFEVMFYGLLEVLSERTNELFPFWAVVGANTLAAVCMGALPVAAAPRVPAIPFRRPRWGRRRHRDARTRGRREGVAVIPSAARDLLNRH